MAIYTNYGRYIKAKHFKEMIQSQGALYMVLGFGNPKWDNMESFGDESLNTEENVQKMPIAPYNTDIITKDTTEMPSSLNQFFDDKVQQVFLYSSGNTNNKEVSIYNGKPCKGLDGVDDTSTGELMYKYKNLVPPFPCIWHSESGTDPLITDSTVTQNTYENYYITEDGNDGYLLNNIISGTSVPITWPSQSSPLADVERQYFSELALRGESISNGNFHPAGILGAVKCTVSFVKDVGTEFDRIEPNGNAFFWYGDRYWQIVNADDEDIDRYITEYDPSDNADNTQVIYPHHLVVRAMIPPSTFTGELRFDQHLIAREIALFTKKQRPSSNPGEAPEVLKPSYRVSDCIFNFGQYYKDSNDHWNVDPGDNKQVLNFTLPCTIDGRTYPGDEYDFKFILHDYIRGGGVRHPHSMDLISYIIGF